jgi:hypothetical protein
VSPALPATLPAGGRLLGGRRRRGTSGPRSCGNVRSGASLPPPNQTGSIPRRRPSRWGVGRRRSR